MGDRKKAAVLMSTYNGEKYLGEQLDSILRQENVDVDIFVRDDGSSDQTCAILKQYCQKGRVHIAWGSNIGLGSSFMQLVYAVPDTFDYYCFSDQDDIWLDEKLDRAIKKIEQADKPCLYVSNEILADQTGKPYGMREIKPSDCELMRIVCQNRLAGCTMLWNPALMRLLQEKNMRPSRLLLASRYHDVWVALMAAMSGEIILDQSSYILYRQHENNVCGGEDQKSLRDTWQNAVKKLRSPRLLRGRSRTCLELYTKCAHLLRDEKELVYTYAFYRKSPRLKKKMLEMTETFTGESRAAFVIKVLLNIV